MIPLSSKLRRFAVRTSHALTWLVAALLIASLFLFRNGVRLYGWRENSVGDNPSRVRSIARNLGTPDASARDAIATGANAKEDRASAKPPADESAEIDISEHLDGRRYDPAFAPIWHRQQQRIVEHQYGDTLAEMNLADDAAATLKDLLTARREAVVDAADAARDMGIAGPEVKMAVKHSVEELDDEIRQAVGSDDGFEQLVQAPSVSEFKDTLKRTVAQDLAAGGNPLSSNQLYALSKGYIRASNAYVSSAQAGSNTSDQAKQLAPEFQALLSDASDYLNPAQVSAVNDFLSGPFQLPQ